MKIKHPGFKGDRFRKKGFFICQHQINVGKG